MSRRNAYILMAVTAVLLMGLIWEAVSAQTDHFAYFQRFAITVHNESDFDLVSIETGIVSSSEKDIVDRRIKAGASAVIKPKLSMSGEGAVYLKYTDSQGNTKETIACGYTESLTGRTAITIDNDGISKNEQRCY
ncbi:hypothetical protein FHS16_002052 [Paenibacillus endophyticus]|uniref:Uncharacterized protein n=1 Tax=Paenibacillus endophyticus TaxID=1294268 RepID=A0A7W5G9T4_9BACL|nr:hypothetical protein [Paenibacillus endophyticus]MBB3152006.1 hypothetical protein [Paenibacillus endophyticus]